MTTISKTTRRYLSNLDLGILALHCSALVVVGLFAFGDLDPNWAGLQIAVIVMMLGLWAGGIVVTALIARVLTKPWARAAILLAGPFVGLAVLVGTSWFA